MSDARKILVTGASGYVGGRLVTALLADNAKVRVFVRMQLQTGNLWSGRAVIPTGALSQ